MDDASALSVAAAAAAASSSSIDPNQGSATSSFKGRVVPMADKSATANVKFQNFLRDLDLEVCGGSKSIGEAQSQRRRLEYARTIIAQVDAALTPGTSVIATPQTAPRIEPLELVGVGEQFAN